MCPPLAHPVNGEVRLNGMSAGSQATYLCGGEYQLSGPVVRECGLNGQWAGTAPTCVREFNSLLPNDAIWHHDLCELSISLWEFKWLILGVILQYEVSKYECGL